MNIRLNIYFAYLKTIVITRKFFSFLFHKLNNIVAFLFKSAYSEYREHMFFLDLNDTNRILSNQEEYSLDSIKNYIKEGDVVVDVGASIGMYTLEMAKLVGDKGRVIAFEPLKEGFDLMKKNVQLNGYEDRVRIQNKAVTNKTGKGKLFYCPYHIGASIMYNTFDDREEIEVDTIKLDDFFKSISKKVSFIKIDADGSEYFILQGAKNVLKQTKNMIIEFVPENIKAQGVTPKEFLDLIKSYGFKIYSINDSKEKIESGDLDYLLNRFKSGDDDMKGLGEYINLLCVKEDKALPMEAQGR